jgi:hypothetical protein
MDYAAWSRRVSIFLRGMTHLPGEIEINDGIEFPGTDDFTQDWLRSDDCSLPTELKAFLTMASKRCCFRYRWRPTEQLHAKIHDLFQGRSEITGGADFCESARYQNYDNRDWFQHDFPTLLTDATASLMQQLPSEFAALFASTPGNDMMESVMKSAGVTNTDRVHGRITLLTLEGGDQISLVCKETEATRPVVYVSSTEPKESRTLSASFDQFLLDWEQLCYITPSLENLRPWLNSATGILDPDSSKTARLREMLMSASSVQRNNT